jgi:hypothetical protein
MIQRITSRRRPAVPNRSVMTEHDIADARLGDFNPEGSRGEAIVRQIYPEGELTRRSLYSFASVLSALANVPLQRDLTRRKSLLVKWFDEHYSTLEPFMVFITLRPSWTTLNKMNQISEWFWPILSDWHHWVILHSRSENVDATAGNQAICVIQSIKTPNETHIGLHDDVNGCHCRFTSSAQEMTWYIGNHSNLMVIERLLSVSSLNQNWMVIFAGLCLRHNQCLLKCESRLRLSPDRPHISGNSVQMLSQTDILFQEDQEDLSGGNDHHAWSITTTSLWLHSLECKTVLAKSSCFDVRIEMK